MPTPDTFDGLPILYFARPQEWANWLAAHHNTAVGVWLQLVKKAAARSSISYDEALEEALCYGWIDSQKRSYDDESWLQRFTPRKARSSWSKVNREKAEKLIANGRMQPAGLQEVDRAKADGRWTSAYDSQSTSDMPPDFQAELNAHPEAAAFYETLNSRNRYAILHRIQTAKKAETRARRIQQFVEMLEKQEKLYP